MVLFLASLGKLIFFSKGKKAGIQFESIGWKTIHDAIYWRKSGSLNEFCIEILFWAAVVNRNIP